MFSCTKDEQNSHATDFVTCSVINIHKASKLWYDDMVFTIAIGIKEGHRKWNCAEFSDEPNSWKTIVLSAKQMWSKVWHSSIINCITI